MDFLNFLKSVIAVIGVFAICNLILLTYRFSTRKYELFKIIPLVGFLELAKYINSLYLNLESKSLNIIFTISLVSSLILYFIFGKKVLEKEEKTAKYSIRLEHEGGTITYKNPFNGFLIYGGAEAGKTSSLGKPLLKEFMRNKFSMFIYDAKDSDYTLTATQIRKDCNYPYPIFNIDLYDATNSHRTNIFSPTVLKDDILLPVFAEIFFSSFLKDGEKKDEWFDMALGVFKGVCWVFFKEHSEFCTIPHICNLIQYASVTQLKEFLSKNDIGKNYATTLFNSEGSEKTEKSIMVNLTKTIANFSANKNACYVLSGNDFECTLTDENNPKTICISNTFSAREVISPIVVLLFVSLAKQIKFGNKIPIAFFLDEATTFKIPDLEGYPSELREYLVAFIILTQSGGKIEKLYTKFDRSSLESNLANQFYGFTGDTLAFDNYAKQFSRIDEKHKSYTRGANDKRSTTTSTRKEVRYDGEFFGSLQSGEFVGKAKNANVTKFQTRFKQYTGGKADKIDLPRTVKKQDIEDNYDKIIQDIKSLL